MKLKTTPHSFNLRLDDEQHAELGRLAEEAGMPVQQFIELRLFGRIRARFDPRAPRKVRNQGQLDLHIDNEERPLNKSA